MRFLIPILLLTACSAPDAAETKDVATRLQDWDPIYLYYVDSTDLLRGQCQADSQIYDRAHCAAPTRRIPTSRVYTQLQAGVAGDLATRETAVRELQVKIAQVDTKLLELMTGGQSSNPARVAELRRQIEEGEAALAPVDRKVVELRDQIARVEAQAAQSADPDLLRLLARLRDELARTTADQSARRDAVHELYRLLLAEVSVLDDRDTYEALQRQRTQFVQKWQTARQEYGETLRKAVGVNRLFKMLADQTFVYEHFRGAGVYPETEELARLMAAHYQVESDKDYTVRTTDMDVWATCTQHACDAVIKMKVPRGAKLSELSCELSNSSSTCVGIGVKAPDGTGIWVEQTSFYLRRGQVPRFDKLFDAPAPGTWEIDGRCGPATNFYPRFTCRAVVD